MKNKEPATVRLNSMYDNISKGHYILFVFKRWPFCCDWEDEGFDEFANDDVGDDPVLVRKPSTDPPSRQKRSTCVHQ